MEKISLMLPNIIGGLDLIVVTLTIIAFVMYIASTSLKKFQSIMLVPLIEIPLFLEFFGMIDQQFKTSVFIEILPTHIVNSKLPGFTMTLPANFFSTLYSNISFNRSFNPQVYNPIDIDNIDFIIQEYAIDMISLMNP